MIELMLQADGRIPLCPDADEIFAEQVIAGHRDAGMADVLVSHYPPDMIPGSVALESRFHVFGHDHSLKDFPDSPRGTKYFNVSVYNELNEKF